MKLDYEFRKQNLWVLGLVFVALLNSLPSAAQAAQVFAYPETQIVPVGESVILEIRIDTEGETINALELEGSLQGDGTVIKEITTSGSVFPVFPERPSFSGSRFSFFGAVPNGFVGQGIVGRVIISSMKAADVDLIFASTSRVFLNDAENSKANLTVKGSGVKIVPISADYIFLKSETQPNQNKWSTTKLFRVSWDVIPDASYAYTLSRLSTDEPDPIPKSPVGSIQFSNLDDGIYYFAVCLIKDKQCGIVSRYRAMIDTTGPEWVSVAYDKGSEESQGKPTVSFLAKDRDSGMDHYEISLDEEANYVKAISPFVLPDNFAGSLTILAFDRAGNLVSRQVTVPRGKSSSLLLIIATIVIGILILALWITRRLRKNKRI